MSGALTKATDKITFAVLISPPVTRLVVAVLRISNTSIVNEGLFSITPPYNGLQSVAVPQFEHIIGSPLSHNSREITVLCPQFVASQRIIITLCSGRGLAYGCFFLLNSLFGSIISHTPKRIYHQ